MSKEEQVFMRKSWVKKAVVCGILFLFIGTSVIPSIGKNIEKVIVHNDTFYTGNRNETFTIHPTDDTQILNIEGNENTNHGNEYWMSTTQMYAPYHGDSLVMFDLSSIIPPAVVISASLNLYFFDIGWVPTYGRKINLYRITSGWDESNVTWNTQPTYASTPTSNSTVPNSTEQWMVWNVAADIQAFINKTIPNQGWKVTDEDAWDGPYSDVTVFYTKEGPGWYPYLEIEVYYPPTIRYVGGSGPGNYTKIQDAINDAREGDTVFVYDDSSPYNEYLTFSPPSSTQQISFSLIGENKYTTIIDGSITIRSNEDHHINISGYTFRNGGLMFGDSSYIDLSGNIINGGGIGFEDSYFNIISNNTLINSSGLKFELQSLYSNRVENNTVNGKPIIYFEEETDIVVEAGAGQVILINCDNITVHNQEYSKVGLAIQCYNSEDVLILNNTISNCSMGMGIGNLSNGFILNNTISNCSMGMQIANSSNDLILNNTISNCSVGMDISYSCNNKISSNNILNVKTPYGLAISHCCNNIISSNNILNCGWSFACRDSNYNNISHNVIIVYENELCGMHVFTSSFNIFYMNTIECFGSEDHLGVDTLRSDNNNYSMNTIINTTAAFQVGDSYNNTFYMNDISNSIFGFWMYSMHNQSYQKTSSSSFNYVLKNNLKRVMIKGLSQFITSLKTKWDENFWGRPRIAPKLILGFKIINGMPIPTQIEFDFHPAKKSYMVPKMVVTI